MTYPDAIFTILTLGCATEQLVLETTTAAVAVYGWDPHLQCGIVTVASLRAYYENDRPRTELEVRHGSLTARGAATSSVVPAHSFKLNRYWNLK